MSELDETIVNRLHVDRQRYTPSRRSIVHELERSDRPMSIPELLAAHDGLAQSSAYRNLAVLERAGVVRRIVTHDDFARYELAEDLTEHHHHLVCTTCGIVEDVTLPAPVETVLDDCLQEIADAHGFTGADHQLELIGTCARCRPR